MILALWLECTDQIYLRWLGLYLKRKEECSVVDIVGRESEAKNGRAREEVVLFVSERMSLGMVKFRVKTLAMLKVKFKMEGDILFVIMRMVLEGMEKMIIRKSFGEIGRHE